MITTRVVERGHGKGDYGHSFQSRSARTACTTVVQRCRYGILVLEGVMDSWANLEAPAAPCEGGGVFRAWQLGAECCCRHAPPDSPGSLSGSWSSCVTFFVVGGWLLAETQVLGLPEAPRIQVSCGASTPSCRLRGQLRQSCRGRQQVRFGGRVQCGHLEQRMCPCPFLCRPSFQRRRLVVAMLARWIGISAPASTSVVHNLWPEAAVLCSGSANAASRHSICPIL